MTSFTRPARSDLISRIKSDINGRLPGADSRLRRNWLNGLGTAHGGAMDGAYGYLDTIANNVMPDSADEAHLVRWANFWGVPPKGASLGTGTATGTGQNGKRVPANTVIQRADSFDYVTTADATVVGGVVTVPVTASAPGLIGSADAGVQLALASPIAGIDGTFTVNDPGIVGADAETPSELLVRLEQRIQNPPKGGGPGDYEAWALEMSGVTRAWEYPLWMGLGTVGLAFVFDDRPNIIPTAADVAAMQAFLETVIPVQVTAGSLYVFAPVQLLEPFSIQLTPSNAATQAAVTAALQEFFIENAVPSGVLLRSQYSDAVGLAAGVTDYAIPTPAGNIVPAAGQLPVLGAITWL